MGDVWTELEGWCGANNDRTTRITYRRIWRVELMWFKGASVLASEGSSRGSMTDAARNAIAAWREQWGNA